MSKARRALIAAVAGLSIGMLPAHFDTVPFGGGIAHAKNGDNGSGGGGGGGGDRGGGRGGDNGKAGGNSKGGDGGKGGGSEKASSGGGFLKSLLRGSSGKSAGTRATTKVKTTAKVKTTEKVKNLHARLGSLNSLQRNVNAYLNSSSPRMALIREYVLGTAQSQLAAEALAAAQDKFDAALAEFGALGGDTASIEGLILDQLNTKLTELNGVDTTGMTPEDLALLEAEKAAVQAAIDLASAQAAADAAVAPDAAALEAALIAAANPNFQSDPIDPDVLEWATAVLDGKITEVKAILAAEAVEQEAVEPELVPVLPE